MAPFGDGSFGPFLLFGAVVWSPSLVHLPAMNLAPPVWKCPPAQLASDADFHLIYGAAATYATLGG